MEPTPKKNELKLVPTVAKATGFVESHDALEVLAQYAFEWADSATTQYAVAFTDGAWYAAIREGEVIKYIA